MTEILLAVLGSQLLLWPLQFVISRHYGNKDKQDLVTETLAVLTYNKLADKIEYCLTKGYATPEERREIEKLEGIYKKWGWNGDMDARMEKVYALRTNRPPEEEAERECQRNG